MKKITSEETIKKIEPIFVRLGYPRTITLDNGRQFISTEFEEYCHSRNISLNHTAPYWPQANDEVERQNSSLLKRLKISHSMNRDCKTDLLHYLMMYYTNAHSVTGKAPSVLLQNRLIRSKIPSISDIETTPPITTEVQDRDRIVKHRGKERKDARRHAKPSDIQVGDRVLVQNLVSTGKLTPTFNGIEYQVMERRGSCVKIIDPVSRSVFEINVAHLKKISPQTTSNEKTSPSVTDNTTSNPSSNLMNDQGQEQSSRRLPRQMTRPSWHRDYFVNQLEEKGRCGDSE